MGMKFVWLACTNPKPYCDALDVSINDSTGFGIANPLEKYCKKLVLTEECHQSPLFLFGS
jgi:hypothetical protein